MAIQSINPATEEILATFDEASPAAVEQALAAAQAALIRWRQRSIAERGRSRPALWPSTGCAPVE